MKNLQRSRGVRGRETVRCSAWILSLLGLCFLVGLYLGYLYAAKHADEVSPEIRRYINEYAKGSGEVRDGVGSFLYALFCYLRYPLAAFLCGFASFGILLLPVLAGTFAFSLGYSVCCLAFAFGKSGVALAASLFAFRSILSLPCFFLLAYPAFLTSLALARYACGKGTGNAALYPTSYFYRFFLALAFLTAGAAMDVRLSSALFSLLPLG